MKRYLNITLLCLLPVFAFSQTKGNNSYYQQESIQQVKKVQESPVFVYSKWRCVNEGYWGSFWWKVTKQRLDGTFFYTVYVFSNSYFNLTDSYGNYKKAITKITDCVVWAKDYDEQADFSVGSVVCDWETTYLFQFSTPDPSPQIKLLYGEVSPYDYSKIKK